MPIESKQLLEDEIYQLDWCITEKAAHSHNHSDADEERGGGLGGVQMKNESRAVMWNRAENMRI